MGDQKTKTCTEPKQLRGLQDLRREQWLRLWRRAKHFSRDICQHEAFNVVLHWYASAQTRRIAQERPSFCKHDPKQQTKVLEAGNQLLELKFELECGKVRR